MLYAPCSKPCASCPKPLAPAKPSSFDLAQKNQVYWTLMKYLPHLFAVLRWNVKEVGINQSIHGID